jgi:glycosyltransferase involved in cell wall biosynthesis
MNHAVPLVTVITVCRNILDAGRREHFLEMFSSVTAQTYPNIEHVIIDGASTDGTIDFIKQTILGQKNIRFSSEPDSGIYHAMNKGIHWANGEFVAFMNTDDKYIKDTAITDLIKTIVDNDAGFACAHARIKKEKGFHVFKADFSARVIGIPFCHQTMLVKKTLFEEYGFFDEQYTLCADSDFILKLFDRGIKGAILDDVIVLYDDEGVSRQYLDRAQNEAAQILKQYIYKSSLFSLQDCKRINQLRFLSLRLWIKILLFIITSPRTGFNTAVHTGAVCSNILGYLLKTRCIHYVRRAKKILRFRFVVRPLERLYKRL